ncbi:tRNA (adenosine(37)-N6)-dimethylallyltransferase MiaA [Spiroplasma endosymbiont of Polydrusus cervinus]|uniref:tRNA (adenosine(37)-N6)-dimethylallyltransferase MiaA n=1 Tax=Spiroplasma endosymbiont of Polydrusus cervinus TaxID=3066287 RepID=UPI0030CD500F
MSKKVILIVGPTGSGKTDLSIKIAQKFHGGECVNVDATQIFNGLNLATNKITPTEQTGIPHHLLSTVDLKDNYSIKTYQQEGRKILEKLWAKNKLPIVVGGSGLYINALLKNYCFSDQGRDLELVKKYEQVSNDTLWEKLATIDPQASAKIHPNNRKRVWRALEYYFQTGTLKSSNDHHHNDWYVEPYIIGLLPDKIELHQRLHDRVLQLIARGLFAEVTAAYEYCDYDLTKQSMKIIGCPEIVRYLNGELSYEATLDAMVQANKIYAKKQVTWFKHQLKNVHWYSFHYAQFNDLCQQIILDCIL